MKLPGDPNLPGGCTDRDIDEAMGGNVGYEDCPDCDGTGRTGSECCGVELTKAGLCSRCGDGATDESCTKCGGSGQVEFDIEERKREARELARMERAEDERRERNQL